MAASVAVSAFSSILVWNYREVIEVLNISGPSQTRDMTDVTSHDSDSGFREFIPSVIAGGEVTLDGNLIVGDTGGQVAFHTDVQGGTKRNGFIVMPMAVGASLFFAAYAKGFEASFPYEDKIGVSGSLVVTGQPLYLPTQATGLTTPFRSGIKDGGVNTGAALTIIPAGAATTYEYTCTVDADTTGVKLTITCASQTPYIQGIANTSGAQTSAAIALGAAGTVTTIFILCYTTATPPGTSPRVYRLLVTRPAA